MPQRGLHWGWNHVHHVSFLHVKRPRCKLNKGLKWYQMAFHQENSGSMVLSWTNEGILFSPRDLDTIMSSWHHVHITWVTYHDIPLHIMTCLYISLHIMTYVYMFIYVCICLHIMTSHQMSLKFITFHRISINFMTFHYIYVIESRYIMLHLIIHTFISCVPASKEPIPIILCMLCESLNILVHTSPY